MKKISIVVLALTLALLTVALCSCGKCNHEWDEGTVTREATCTENGITAYTCTKCGEVKKLATDPAPHTNTVLSATGSTCTTPGEQTLLCSVCNTVTVEEIPTRAHTFSVRVSSTSATCSLPGKNVYRCATCTATKEESTAATGIHDYHSTEEYMMIKTLPTSTTVGERIAHCKTCTLEKVYPYYYSEYQADLQLAKQKLQSVDISSFTTKNISSFSTSAYKDPLAYPTVGEHPRLIINTKTLAEIKAFLAKPESAEFFNEVIRVANGYDSGLLGEVKTVASATGKGPAGEHNLDEELYDCLMAKAFLYLVTGVETYAIDAIRMTKEFMATIVIKSTAFDPERNWGYAMYAAAIVYDWCYDAMSDQDKIDLVRGIEWRLCKTITSANAFQQNMEMGFPPSKQGAVCGHGSERQLLRDYLAVALAIYDEHPSWYEYIGGRFYQDFVPVRNEFYKAQMYPQGLSVYVNIRFTSDVWSALLMKSAVGSIPYNGSMAAVMHSVYSRVVDGKIDFFDSGDDDGRTTTIKSMTFTSMALAYLYNDSTCMAWADYTDYSGTSWLYQLIFRSTGVTPLTDRFEELDLICYNGGYYGEMVAHSDWSTSAASVLMKIGGRITANHDHGDVGSFQIYYKGMLAGDTGVYDSYGTEHFKKYHQATIAHNSIVIYRNGLTVGQRNGSSYSEPNTLDRWMDDMYITADVTGVSYGYMDEAKTAPKYAYAASDISPAYEGVLTKGDRRMLAVFDTNNPDVPMYFFVYDNFTGTNSTDAMTFLLHTKSQPTISGKTVSAFSGTGKIVLQNIKGGDKIEAIGGVGKNFMVNGTQVETTNGRSDGYWGRVEISTQNSSKNDVQLNVMYVTDNSNKTLYSATAITGANIAGSIIGNTAAVFVEDTTEYKGTINFSTAGAGDSLNYYVSGVKAGNWVVTVGSTTLTVTVEEGEGLLHFTAPSGLVNITPAN